MNVTVLAVLVVLVAICMGLLALYLKDPEYIWEIERRYKWHRLKLEIKNISSVHSRTSGKGKGVSLLERGQLKSSLIRLASQYLSSSDHLFCKSVFPVNAVNLPYEKN